LDLFLLGPLLLILLPALQQLQMARLGRQRSLRLRHNATGTFLQTHPTLISPPSFLPLAFFLAQSITRQDSTKKKNEIHTFCSSQLRFRPFCLGGSTRPPFLRPALPAL